MIVKALGQEPLAGPGRRLASFETRLRQDRVDPATGATSIAGLYAGGDCLRGGGEVVDAVQDGKIAASGIHKSLAGV